MEQIVLVAHLLIALAIIGLIMLQQGKGADAGASFGAGASQTIFGSDGSGNVLTRATAWLVAAFFATSFGLAMIASDKSSPTNDLGLDLPDSVEVLQESDLPQVQDGLPAMSAGDDLPALEDEFPAENSEEDVPAL